MKAVNSPQFLMNIFTVHRIRSRKSKTDGLIYDQGINPEKLSRFYTAEKIHEKEKPIFEIRNQMQEEIKMRKNVNRVKCDIQSHIIGAGFNQKEAVEVCATEYGWSDSDSNFSNKLEKQTIRYREVLELAEVLGYEIVWQRRRDD